MSGIQQLLTEHIDIWSAADSGKKSGRGRASSNAGSVYGIRKLRELILELAVRGKLVPQDANDEPACVLLKQIQVEKNKLIVDGKIKKDKLRPPITEEERPFVLAQGWEWTTLASVSLVNPRNNAEDNSPASFVTMTMIDVRFNSLHDQETRLWKEIKQGFTHFAEGDIGVAKITPCFENSKACVFSGLLNGVGAGTTELHIVRPVSTTLAPRYVLAYLKSPQFLLVGETRMTGTAGQKRLPKEFVESNPFPLPPLAEQHRIVAKVDELMALCDQLEAQHIDAAEAHEKLVSHLLGTLTLSQNAEDFSANWQRIAAHFDTLFTTEASIDALKQTLLQLAVMGKLVPQDLKDEPASELLARLKSEKSKSIPLGQIKKEKPISNDEKQFRLPDEWEWVRLEDLMPEFQNGASSRGDSDGKSVVVLRLADIKNRRISLDEPRELLISSNTIDKYRLSTGDILVVRVNGSADLVGRFIACEEKFDGIYCDHFIRMRVEQSIMNPRFLASLGASQLVRNKIKDLFITTAGQKTVNQSHIGSLIIPLLSLAEQLRIVTKIDELLTLCDQLKSRITATNQLQQKIADVMVEQAVA
ncbi:restriction endonuclease subunit S [Glaciimonas sp. PAMC28666]|uniref:restriction endonuclease subunit S n=1 Tax=Glaciimonas sp. PAMC28666 TaxID=2807626 RepID=UPI0019644713|nr:restriction endonuclease subunit S [Glaciimonas sp. PAMC28666]QRX81821.1 restriction endonuclease subunit S [Glaciimonas sp. PAMC28666]